MSAIIRLSSLADSFPTLEVEYEDLLSAHYRQDARWVDGLAADRQWLDCLGVVLEVYRRAGLGLPDPKVAGGSIFDFADLFEIVPDGDRLYDLAMVRREEYHVAIVVRTGVLVSARAEAHVYTQRLNVIRRLAGVRFYRVRSDLLP